MTNVDDDANDVDDNAYTASYTLSKAPVYTENVDDVNDVDKNAPFTEKWVEVSDEELPPEFLKPTQ